MPEDIEPKNDEQRSTGAHSVKKKTPLWRKVLYVLLALCIIGVICGCAYMLLITKQINDAANTDNVVPATPEPTEDPEPAKVDNPIDFASLQASNADICGWVYVPGTNVNHVVACRPDDDTYYLSHDTDGNYFAPGTVFMEASVNSSDFSDSVTILYGHNSSNDAMFSSLHWFQDSEFFNENQYIYVYTPGHIYTYTIVSAFTTDNLHLMVKYDFFDAADEVQNFESFIVDPGSISQNVRQGLEMDENSKLIVLSTCNTGATSEYGRYLVCGVMTSDQLTN